MRWSLTLGSIGGTAIRIHVTFLLFLIWLGAIYYRQGGAEAAWQGTIFVVLIFLCVLLHELGHVFAARRTWASPGCCGSGSALASTLRISPRSTIPQSPWRQRSPAPTSFWFCSTLSRPFLWLAARC